MEDLIYRVSKGENRVPCQILDHVSPMCLKLLQIHLCTLYWVNKFDDYGPNLTKLALEVIMQFIGICNLLHFGVTRIMLVSKDL